jgi:dTDP-4-amino-4,6-dideoxygalactose transaminase
LGVHLYGRPADIDCLIDLADKHNLQLMFDAAHAFGSSYSGKMIGGFGACEVFSFHATKVFNTFEGGAVTTQDDELAEKLRYMRNFGFVGEDQVSYLGTNGKMAEVNAVMGLTNLESLDYFLKVNRDNYFAYSRGLADIDGIDLINYDESEKNNYQYIIITIDEHRLRCSRDQLKAYLTENGVVARRYFSPGCHRMEPYASESSGAKILPNTELFSEQMLALPTGTQIDVQAVSGICEMIRDYVS